MVDEQLPNRPLADFGRTRFGALHAIEKEKQMAAETQSGLTALGESLSEFRHGLDANRLGPNEQLRRRIDRQPLLVGSGATQLIEELERVPERVDLHVAPGAGPLRVQRQPVALGRGAVVDLGWQIVVHVVGRWRSLQAQEVLADGNTTPDDRGAVPVFIGDACEVDALRQQTRAIFVLHRLEVRRAARGGHSVEVGQARVYERPRLGEQVGERPIVVPHHRLDEQLEFAVV